MKVDSKKRSQDYKYYALAGYVHQKRDIPTPRAAEAGQELVAVPTVE